MPEIGFEFLAACRVQKFREPELTHCIGAAATEPRQLSFVHLQKYPVCVQRVVTARHAVAQVAQAVAIGF